MIPNLYNYMGDDEPMAKVHRSSRMIDVLEPMMDPDIMQGPGADAVLDIYGAAELLREFLKEHGVRVVNMKYLNMNRHCVLMTASTEKYYMLFKRKPFNTYGSHIGNEGIGESINMDALKIALENEMARIVIVYPDGKVFAKRPEEWLRCAKSMGTIRKTDVKDNGAGNETVCSVPFSTLKRWK